jgi:hypothetical protein
MKSLPRLGSEAVVQQPPVDDYDAFRRGATEIEGARRAA